MKIVSWANISINQFLGLGLIKYLMWHARVDKVAVSGRWKVDNRFASDSVWVEWQSLAKASESRSNNIIRISEEWYHETRTKCHITNVHDSYFLSVSLCFSRKPDSKIPGIRVDGIIQNRRRYTTLKWRAFAWFYVQQCQPEFTVIHTLKGGHAFKETSFLHTCSWRGIAGES